MARPRPQWARYQRPRKRRSPATVTGSGRSDLATSQTRRGTRFAAGATLDWQSIKFIFEELDPFYPWDKQPPIWEDDKYALYYKNIYDFQIKKYIADGTLPNQTYDIDGLFQAKPIWLEMRELKAKAETLMAKAPSGEISEEKKKLMEAAKFHYDGFNYLDAVRFLEAAVA